MSEQSALLLMEKAELRRVLREFENGFTAMNGRYDEDVSLRPWGGA